MSGRTRCRKPLTRARQLAFLDHTARFGKLRGARPGVQLHVFSKAAKRIVKRSKAIAHGNGNHRVAHRFGVAVVLDIKLGAQESLGRVQTLMAMDFNHMNAAFERKEVTKSPVGRFWGRAVIEHDKHRDRMVYRVKRALPL